MHHYLQHIFKFGSWKYRHFWSFLCIKCLLTSNTFFSHVGRSFKLTSVNFFFFFPYSPVVSRFKANAPTSRKKGSLQNHGKCLAGNWEMALHPEPSVSVLNKTAATEPSWTHYSRPVRSITVSSLRMIHKYSKPLIYAQNFSVWKY